MSLIKADILPKLTPPAYTLFKGLMHMLTKVHANAEQNKMNSRNLAIVWCPNFIRTDDALMDCSLCSFNHSLGGLSILIKICIEDYARVFE